MVEQRDISSTSSNISGGKGFLDRLSPRKKKHFEKFMMNQAQEHLLLELANLHDQGVHRFMEGPFLKNAPTHLWKALFGGAEESLLGIRDDLRELWDGKTPATRKEEILTLWLRMGPADFLLPRWKGQAFHLIPNYYNLLAFVFKGVADLSRRFGHCQNPGCPTPYFLSKRASQKYCERGECTAYAQRQYALKWWNQEGRKRRQTKRKSKLKALRGR